MSTVDSSAGAAPPESAAVAMLPLLVRWLREVAAPAARVGHIGLYRDPKTLKPVEYYCKLPPDVAERTLIVVDPMLATGGSSSAALTLLKEKGAKSMILMCLVAAPDGIRVVNHDHPDVPIYVASVDDHLNEKGYIVPGLGDAGDRIFGTI